MRRWVGAFVLLAVVGAAACSDDGATPGPPPAGPAREASYFFEHHTKLPDAPPDMAGALSVGIATFSQPAGRSVQPADPTLTLELSVSYVGQGPEIVCLDAIPWKAGDVEKGPGAHFTKQKRFGFSIKSGEKINLPPMPLVVDEIRATTTATVPPGGGGPAPGASPMPVPINPAPTTTAPAELPTTTLGGMGVGVQAAGRLSAQEPAPSTSPPVTTVPRPSTTPAGPTLPAKGSVFDPELGVQVILVCAHVGEGVAPDAYRNVTLVPPDQFVATYGKYRVIRQGIPVPLDRLL